MGRDKEVKLINEVVDIAEIIITPRTSWEEPYKKTSYGNTDILFLGVEKLKIFQHALVEVFNSNREVSETFTLKGIEKEFLAFIRTLKNENTKCTTQKLECFFDKFLQIKLQESEILYEFYGGYMNAASMQFGDFTIYNFDLSIDKLILKYPFLGLHGGYFSNRKSTYLIGINVKAREQSKAVEIADALCETFENVFNYAIADLEHIRTIGILNFSGRKSISKVICNNDEMGFNINNNVVIEIDIGDPFFKKKKAGNDIIWNLITKKNKTELEERLLNAIEWIGKAIQERDSSKALVQFVFGIEGMLQYNPDQFLTPSIGSQLSDWMAFIIQDDLAKRKKIAKFFKDIYRKRSAIAHGAAKKIEKGDLEIALQLAKLLVRTFLVNKPFNEMSTMKELNDYMTELKFK